jgi:UDP-glucose 4-epimerase
MANILITGALGFVGRALTVRLRRDGHRLSGTTRDAERRAGAQEIPLHLVPPFDGETDFSRIVAGAEIVIHLAARVHVIKERAADPLAQFRHTNRDGTRNLAMASAKAGVKRFIFISTAKVMGEDSGAGAFTDAMSPAPEDAYALSKWEAEQALAEVAAGTGLEIVILRPPLVHGPGVEGNLATLLKACARGLVLPFGTVANRRSLIHVDNLADAIAACLTDPRAAGERFLLSDGEPVSTPELAAKLARGLGRRPRLLNVPPGLLLFLGRLIGRSGEVRRLIGSLVVDDARFRGTLDWSPPVSRDAGLEETAMWYGTSNMLR